MHYVSTRGAEERILSTEAIARGMASDGGLYLPESFPPVSLDEIRRLSELSYMERAAYIFSLFLTDFPEEAIFSATRRAYQSGDFEEDRVAPLSVLAPDVYMLELWHGPTCAFKDVALQILPHLSTYSAGVALEGKEMVILVATSGDTGKAALEGFKNVPGIKVIVFYPEEGVSPIQKLQMTTQEGENLHVSAIKGNFDDAQNGVKAIFADPDVTRKLAESGKVLSSANSINFGRLLPQIVYYFSSYCDLLSGEEISAGDKVNFVVPTGNFGNILAGYYASRMGLPVGKLICASNKNNVLTDFIYTGIYDANREFHTTISPSMDILISSNLERLLFELCGRSAVKVTGLMNSLKESKKYQLDITEKLGLFWGGFCGEEHTKVAIKEVYDRYYYTMDPHTAVAYGVYQDYVAATDDKTKTIIVSTASPYKFAQSVLEALTNEKIEDGFVALSQLSELTGTDIPTQLSCLLDKTVRFQGSILPSMMKEEVFSFLKI